MTTAATPRGSEGLVSTERDDGHCGGPECFRNDGESIDVCACECPGCVAARERLLQEQGEGDEPTE
jgi:hypothetical protein